MRCDELNSSETILTQEAATHLVVHHSHLGLLALGSLPIGLGRSLGLISTGHDYWVEREEKKHGERVSCDKSNLFWWRIEEIKDTLEIYVYFVSLPLACFLLCACVPYLCVCTMPTPSLTPNVCGSECASPFYTLAPMGGGLWPEKQTCWGQRRETKETPHHHRGTYRGGFTEAGEQTEDQLLIEISQLC